MNEYFIENNYNNENYEFLNSLLDKALLKLNLKNVSFSVILENDEVIKKLNKKYRNINKTTDVLSFPLNDDLNLPIKLLGDIYISIPQMKGQAKEYETGEKRELSFLVIHGLLHLLGHDHEDEEDRKIMRKLEEELLK
ncbi:MAG TPA: rRNA maturation RNase YbeY [Mollicutes bacterium]|nr:rRNA maturation RNase YbeY [Mollicutes bacterium]